MTSRSLYKKTELGLKDKTTIYKKKVKGEISVGNPFYFLLLGCLTDRFSDGS